MTWWEVASQGRKVLRLILRAMVATGERPVFQHLDREAHKAGIERPHEVLEELPEDLVFFDRPLEDSSRIGLTLKGAMVAGLSSGVLDAFLKILAALAELRDEVAPPSPSQAHPVVAHAGDLWVPEMRSPSDLVVIGMLLDSEEIGVVSWTGDLTSPWSIEVDYRIREYANVVTLSDYQLIRDPDEP